MTSVTPVLWKSLGVINLPVIAATSQDKSQVVALAGGGFLVAWEDDSNRTGLGANDIIGQRYDMFGNRIGAEFIVSSLYWDFMQQNVDLAALPGGGFVAGYQSTGDALIGDGENVNGAVFTATGTWAARDDDFRQNAPTNINDITPSVAAFANGSYVIAWSVDDNAAIPDVVTHVVSANGGKGPEIRIEGPGGAASASPQLAALIGAEPQRFAAAYAMTAGTIQFALYDNTTLVNGGNVSGGGGDSRPEIAALTAGGFVVVWQDTSGDGAGNTGVRARLYSHNGTATGVEFNVNTTTAGAQDRPAVAALADGGFAVAWQSAGGVAVQCFTAAGVKSGVEFTLPGAGLSEPSITTLADGRLSVTATQASGANVVGFILDPRPAIIDGTAGNDTINARSIGGTVNGQGGNDTLLGGAAADTLNGGSGNDQVDGGAGNDRLLGGTGVNTLTGGAGSDTFVADRTGDIVITDFRSRYFSANLTGGQQSPPVSTTANGTGQLVLNFAETVAKVTVRTDGLDFNDLQTPADAADNVDDFHIHQAPPGVNGGVIWDIRPDTDTVVNVVTGDFTSTWTGFSAAELAALKAGGTYFNIHTSGFGSGAIRGQITEVAGGSDRLDLTAFNIGSIDTYQFLTATSGGNARTTIITNGVAHTITLNGVAESAITASMLVLAGSRNQSIIGGGLADDLFGAGGRDSLKGSGGNDRLFGETSNDTLNGGSGLDRLDGGSGNDIYVLGSEATGRDKVFDASGIDTITSSIARSLGSYAGIENLALLGTALSGTGNSRNNVLTGNGSGNILSGSTGSDTLIGGIGADTLTGGAGNDKYVYKSASDSRGTRIDTIRDFDDAGNDRIDLSAFSGSFTFIGDDAFTGGRQIRIEDIAGADVRVEINLSGSATPEMIIRLASTTFTSMTAGDFVL